jgi:hypothetical protein
VNSCSRTLRCLLLLWLLRGLLNFEYALLTGNVGKRREDLAVLHGERREVANWRVVDANRRFNGIQRAERASRSDRIHVQNVDARFTKVRMCRKHPLWITHFAEPPMSCMPPSRYAPSLLAMLGICFSGPDMKFSN